MLLFFKFKDNICASFCDHLGWSEPEEELEDEEEAESSYDELEDYPELFSDFARYVNIIL